ncbi:hypothetical protein Pst134EA_007289 [Puccinia striiformis f. sp. tritici]|nr:hypothetical protein Pst134EA_007276 [Puccinia striiformis f. sp. tritici]XP_047809479.1 hypothetical protein Pst134EA_007289 [Puccinia striiformis f. sp. tritici]KAH9460255.1 hypothetical protein Pst134EB_008440 [Puccinia striiformis f. sp. tritici]KAH9470011.1 hypothetical protein Pst134EA_007276 [Puccinia striiformis f. sp. tritici]KAH9470025.1 hypothetical protein Pst134EA_007289 [Puccinia striiformis f. sp. tritici]
MVTTSFVAWLCIIPQLLEFPVSAMNGLIDKSPLAYDRIPKAAESSNGGRFFRSWGSKTKSTEHILDSPPTVPLNQEKLKAWLRTITDGAVGREWIKGFMGVDMEDPIAQKYFDKFVAEDPIIKDLLASYNEDSLKVMKFLDKKQSLPDKVGSNTIKQVNNVLNRLSLMNGQDPETGAKIAHYVKVLARITQPRANHRSPLNKLIITHLNRELVNTIDKIDPAFKPFFTRLAETW